MNNLKIQFDPKQKKFFILVDGHEAVLEFIQVDDHTLDYTHTYVPAELRGRGIAALLVEKALLYARENHQKVIPSCSYVRSYMDAHPEWGDLMSSRA